MQEKKLKLIALHILIIYYDFIMFLPAFDLCKLWLNFFLV